MDAHAVGEGGEARRDLQARADHGGRAAAQVQVLQVAAHQLAAMAGAAGQREADAVEDGLLAEADDILRDVLQARAADEIGDVVRQVFGGLLLGDAHCWLLL